MKCKNVSILLLSLSLIFISCKKEFDSIGLDLQKDPLGNSFSDTTTLIAYSLIEDSLQTNNLSNAIVGYVNDPIFGKTQAGFYTQFDLSGTNVSFGDNLQFDSIVLSLQYTGYFGDTLSSIKIGVYELAESLSRQKSYYSHQTTLIAGRNLTYENNYLLSPKPNTHVRVDTTIQNPQIRIRLDDNFGINRILNNPSLTNNVEFQENFKGLFIVAEEASGVGNLVYLSAISSLSGLTLYYKENGNRKKYTFSISSTNCRYYNYFDHFDYENAATDLKDQIFNHNYGLGKDKLYVQATAGVKTRIKFPYIHSTFKDSNVVINRAELVISNIEDDSYFFYPNKLGLQWVKEENVTYLPDDEIYTNVSYFGGTYISSKKEYRFRITKFIQQLIHQENLEDEINLVVNGAGIQGGRLLLCGTKPGDITLEGKRLRLELSYTTY